jgi:cytochrome c556
MIHIKTITALSALFFIVIFSNSAFAQSEGMIKYRKNVMKSTGGHMGAIIDILKNGLPLTAHIVDHARSINQNNKMTLSMFPKGSGLGDTKAKLAIWEH